MPLTLHEKKLSKSVWAVAIEDRGKREGGHYYMALNILFEKKNSKFTKNIKDSGQPIILLFKLTYYYDYNIAVRSLFAVYHSA